MADSRHRPARLCAIAGLWFSVSPTEQRTRFAIRQVDPVRQWKHSPTDLESQDKWDAYTRWSGSPTH